jgi:alpha-amylase
MTYPSIPIIYYGTEIGMEGGDDPDNRRDMEWQKTDGSEMLTFYKKLAELRSTNPAVKEGSMELLGSDSYYLAYMRKKDDKSVVVVINVQNKEKAVTINIRPETSAYQDALTSKTYEVKNSTLELTLKPLEILLLESS